MTSFQELHAAARARRARIARVVTERLRDPELRVSVHRDGFAPGQSTVNLTISLQCVCMVPDEASDAMIRELAVIAYGQLGSYAHQRFVKYLQTEGDEP